MKPEFAINNEHGQVLALMREGDAFSIVVSHLAQEQPIAVQLWTRAELVAIRNQINKALNARA